MSEIKVNSIKGVGASTAAITVNNTDGTCTANITNRPNKNFIQNGSFLIAQRGTSTAVGSGTFVMDRWSTDKDGTLSATVTQQLFTLGQTDVPGEPKNYLRYAVSSHSGGSYLSLRNYIEDVRTGAGQTLTLSYYAKADASRTVKFKYSQFFGSSGSTQVAADVGTKTLTTSWARYTHTFSLPSISGKTISGGNDCLRILFYLAHNTAQTIEFANVQLEIGSVATDFEHKTFDQELQSCFRYCQVFDSVDGEYNRFAYANASASSAIRIIFPLMKEMRAKPSVAFSGSFECPGVGSFNINNVIMETNTGSRKVACLQQGSVSVTSYQTYQFNANNDTSAKITYSAEL